MHDVSEERRSAFNLPFLLLLNMDDCLRTSITPTFSFPYRPPVFVVKAIVK